MSSGDRGSSRTTVKDERKCEQKKRKRNEDDDSSKEKPSLPTSASSKPRTFFSEESLDFEFRHRYTDQDEAYMKYISRPVGPPPVASPW
jgi:hypothetical protein